MMQSYFPLTYSTWRNVDHYFRRDCYFISNQTGLIASTAKGCMNLLGKACMVVAGAIAAVATPFFFLLDLFYLIVNKVKDCLESEEAPHAAAKEMHPTILEFYRDNKRNDQNITLEEILKKDHQWLESNHVYIQWLFPTEQQSKYNSTASLTDSETRRIFKETPALREKMVRALRLMLSFYGLRLIDNVEGVPPKIEIAANYNNRKENWLAQREDPTKMNHNYLRLTRIIESLGLHGLSNHGKALFNRLEAIYQGPDGTRISEQAYAHWVSANRKLMHH